MKRLKFHSRKFENKSKITQKVLLKGVEKSAETTDAKPKFHKNDVWEISNSFKHVQKGFGHESFGQGLEFAQNCPFQNP